MKHTRKKLSSAVSVLLRVAALLIALVSIVGCTSVKQQPATTQPEASGQESSGGYPAAYQIQFEQAWKKNQDFKGYLTLEGTALSTNVVQGTDNTYYRTHGFDGGTDSRVAFLDYRADIEGPSSQLLIYLPDTSNHVKYAELVNFKNLEYYREHPVISFNSLYRNAKYKIFAVALFPSGYNGIPYQSCMETSDKDQFVTLVQKALDHSILEIPVDVRENDELLTVMTEDLSLQDENGKYARIVVFARKIREGESEAVNTQKAVIKPNKYMPDSWYTQILHTQYLSTVNQEIRREAAKWFSDYELSKISDADLERLMQSRKAEYKKYLNDQEMLLSAEEKAYLYETRRTKAENPDLLLDTQYITARVDDEIVLDVTRSPRDPAATYTWSSSDDSVVSVTGNGVSAKLKAKKEGHANVMVTSGKTTVSCTVEVKEKEKFVLNPSTMTIFVDNSYKIKASSDIQKASSSDTDIATVTINKDTAIVTGVSAGEATITLTGKNGLRATCNVTVAKYKLTLDKTDLTLEKGTRSTVSLTAGEAMNWYVSNSNVVNMSVMENGKVVLLEAIDTGIATVTATARNGVQTSCTITVVDGKVAFSTTHMDMYKGECREMYVTSGNVVKWDISDPSVAQVCIFGDGTYIEVEAIEYGTATISAYGSDGSVATLTVNVSAPQESLTITPYSMTVTQGDLRNITVTSGSASNWVSSDPNVAEVYVVGDGSMAQVEGRNPGTATITVYDNYGGWVNCTVTVEAHVPELVIGPGTVYMNVEDWEDLSVTSGSAVDWQSTDSSVVGVYVVGGDTNNVRIKGEGAGTAQVIAYAADGSTAVCNVTVEATYVETLSLDQYTMTVTAGEWYELQVCAGYAVDWSSSNSDVVGVYVIGGDTNNVQIKGSQAGSATVTAYDADGNSVSCTITVEDPYAAAVEEEALKLDLENIVIEEGEWKEIYVVGGRCVDWNTSNKNIVRIYDVDDPTMIKIKGESAGTAEIIAYAPNGTTRVCKVTVIPYLESETEPYTEPAAEPETEPAPAPETEPAPAPETEPVPEPETEPAPEPEPVPESPDEPAGDNG